jgi:putative spermidine/putrescine transport system ATP-binding protein
MLYVTHDQDEALTMSDRIVLMNGGRIEQQGAPEDVYFRPSTVFSADFIGSSNLIAGTLVAGGGAAALRTALGTLPVAATELADGTEAVLLVRPETMTLSPGAGEPARIEGRLEDTIVMGGVIRHFVRCVDGAPIIVQELNRPGLPRPDRGQHVTAGWDPAQGRLLPPRNT